MANRCVCGAVKDHLTTLAPEASRPTQIVWHPHRVASTGLAATVFLDTGANVPDLRDARGLQSWIFADRVCCEDLGKALGLVRCG